MKIKLSFAAGFLICMPLAFTQDLGSSLKTSSGQSSSCQAVQPPKVAKTIVLRLPGKAKELPVSNQPSEKSLHRSIANLRTLFTPIHFDLRVEHSSLDEPSGEPDGTIYVNGVDVSTWVGMLKPGEETQLLEKYGGLALANQVGPDGKSLVLAGLLAAEQVREAIRVDAEFEGGCSSSKTSCCAVGNTTTSHGASGCSSENKAIGASCSSSKREP